MNAVASAAVRAAPAHVLRPYQEKNVAEILACLQRGESPLYVLPTGGGKCLGRGTPVLMYDGRVLPVQDIRTGDLLMGPDSRPRRVLSTCSGREPLYRVVPRRGDPYVVNESHILSLRMTGGAKFGGYAKGDIVNVGVREWFAASKTFRHCAKGWRTGVDFPSQAVHPDLPPYFLGLWLADGAPRSDTVSISDDHPIIADYLRSFAESVGLVAIRSVSHGGRSTTWRLTRGTMAGGGRGRHTNPLLSALRGLGLMAERHIPDIYRVNDRASRLRLLAGVLDGDGHHDRGGYDVILKDRRLAEDVAYLARSLGFAATRSTRRKTCTNTGAAADYHAVHITGDLTCVPVLKPEKRARKRAQAKDALVTGLRLEPIGEGEYFGFEIDGDRLVLLGDFTVTHNTQVFVSAVETVGAAGWESAIFVHRKELLRQASRRLREFGIPHGVIAPGCELTSHRVHVASIDTVGARFDSLKPWLSRLHLAIADEAHHSVADKWDRVLQLPRLRLGVTATPCRTDGRGLGETGLFQRMVRGPGISELTRLGYLAPAEVYAPPSGLDLSKVSKRGGDYVIGQLAGLVDVDALTLTAVRWYARKAMGEPAVVFCTTVEHAKHVAEAFLAHGWLARSVDGKMRDADRDDAIGGLADGSVQVLTSCQLVGEGLDIPAVSAAILLRPTESTSLYLQQIGRALRPHEDKAAAVILDLVGNTAKHGMYDAERQWDLRSGLRGLERAVAGTWRCRKCHRVQSRPEAGGVMTCPCGATQKTSGFASAAVESHPPIAGIEADTLLRMKFKDAVKQLKTYADLCAYGTLRKMPHPRAWARQVLQRRDEYKARFRRRGGW